MKAKNFMLMILLMIVSSLSVCLAEYDPLVVYCLGNNILYDQALSSYKRHELNVIRFETALDMENQLTTELLSGQGPDVILFDVSCTLDVYRLAQSGMVYDLSSFFASDINFDSKDYYVSILETGKLEDGWYVVPFSFSLPHILTSGMRIKSTEMNLQDTSFRNALAGIIEYSRNTMDKTNALATSLMRRNDITYTLCQASGIQLFDQQRTSVQVENDKFKLLCEFILEMTQDKEQLGAITARYPNDFVNALSRIAILIEDYHFGVNARYYSAYFDKGLNDTMVIYPIPLFDQQNSYAAQVMEYGVVSANTDAPDVAYDLLRHIMDYNAHADQFIRGRVSDAIEIPVRKEYARENVEKLQSTSGGRVKILGQVKQIGRLKTDYADQFIFCLDNIGEAYIPNRRIGGIVEISMKPYFEGKDSFQSCVNELENTLWIYLNE